MRANSQSQMQQHRGAIVPLVAVLLPVFLTMVVFAVDIGLISVAKQQLQNAADAGAVAALTAYQRNPNNGDQAALETMNAQEFLGDNLDFDLVQSVSYGQYNADTNQFTEIPRGNNNTIPQGAQAVRVQLIRSPNNGNGVNLFFAPLIGVDRATIVAEAIAGGSTSCVGFIGIDSVNIGNNVRTDSYNSDLGPYTPWNNNNRFENGSVCSDGLVSLASGANIFGNAAGSNVQIAHGSGANIHGLVSGPANIGNLAINPSPPLGDNDNTTIALGPNWNPHFYIESTRDLIIDQGRQLTLTSGTYHFRNISIQGGGGLHIDGQVEIFVDEELDFGNGTFANVTQVPANLVLNVDKGPVKLRGGNQLHAVVYAPTSDVTIDNNVQLHGAVTGRTLELQGGAQLHYDESLNANATPTGPPELVF